MATQAMLGIIIQIITLIIIIPLSALALFISSMIFKKNIKYTKALIPASIVAGIAFVLKLIGTISQNMTLSLILMGLGFLISIALYLILPNLLLKIDWNQGIYIGLIWFFFMLIISFIVGLLVGLLSVLIGLAIALS